MIFISRPTVCHKKGIGVAARRFCDSDKGQCGARIGCCGSPAEGRRFRIYLAYPPGASPSRALHTYETGWLRKRSSASLQLPSRTDAAHPSLLDLGDRNRCSNHALIAIVVRVQGAVMFMHRFLWGSAVVCSIAPYHWPALCAPFLLPALAPLKD